MFHSKLTFACACLVLAACSVDEESFDEHGTARFALVGTDSDGYLFRLRDALFDIDGPVSTTIGTPDAASPVNSLSADVPVGSYEVALREGWWLERENPFRGTVTAVPATLVSPNPGVAVVYAGQAADVVFVFETDQGTVEMDSGRIDVSIDVDPGDPVAPGCNPETQNCGPGQNCGRDYANPDAFTCWDTLPSAGGQLTPCYNEGVCARSYTCAPMNDLDGCWNEFGCCTRFCTSDADCVGTGNATVCDPLDVASYPGIGRCISP